MNTKKLKQLVLDLAIHGKLVPQDPNDEPASELLKRIQAEKAKSAKGKKSAVSSVDLDEVPFEVPEGWCWCKVTDILTKITDGTHHSPANLPQGDFMYVTAKNIKEQGVDLSNITFVDKVTHEEIYSRCNPEYGDILYIKDGATTGIACINDIKEPFSLLSSVALLKPCKLIENKYLLLYLQSSYCYSSVRETMKGVGITRITLKLIGEWLIPLPPLAEQHRIVAEIEKWFAIIDQLEKNEADLRKSIEQTKKKVLDLAIRGKLVAQNPEDEPAGELLARIRADVETHGRASKSKKSSIPSVDLDEVPFEVPEGWEWCRLGEISTYGECQSVDVKTINDSEWTLELEDLEKDSARVLSRQTISSRPLKGTRHKFSQGDVLYSKLRTYLNKVLVAKENGYCTTEIIPIKFLGYIDPDFMCHVLRSQYFLDYTMMLGYGVKMPRLSTEDARKAYIPLPPLAEQKRIVEKIEEVFGVLERIEGVME